jgi:hypothetical protein
MTLIILTLWTKLVHAQQVDAGSLIDDIEGLIVNDTILLDTRSPSYVGAGQGDDIYVLDASRLTSGKRITISDIQGSNILQLVEGLSVAQSQVTSDALKLTLNNGAQLTVLGADAFRYDLGGDASAGINHYPFSYGAFVNGVLKVVMPTTTRVIATGDPVVISSVTEDGMVQALQMTTTTNGISATVDSISEGKDSARYFKVTVPDGVTNLVIRTEGEGGNPNL